MNLKFFNLHEQMPAEALSFVYNLTRPVVDYLREKAPANSYNVHADFASANTEIKAELEAQLKNVQDVDKILRTWPSERGSLYFCAKIDYRSGLNPVDSGAVLHIFTPGLKRKIQNSQIANRTLLKRKELDEILKVPNF